MQRPSKNNRTEELGTSTVLFTFYIGFFTPESLERKRTPFVKTFVSIQNDVRLGRHLRDKNKQEVLWKPGQPY
jgi:hypothetical protein